MQTQFGACSASYVIDGYWHPMLFIESSRFSKRLPELLDDEAYRLLQATLTLCPGSGSLIPGTGGLRKFRWPRRGTGKRGGLRVIYYWWTERDNIHLLSIYAKSRGPDLTAREARQLRREIEALVQHD